MIQRFGVVALALLLAACASFEPALPPGYTGSTAHISDDFRVETSSKSQLFYVDAINGKAVESGMVLTRRASSGQGFSASPRHATHQVPAQPLRLRLVATHVTGAPIHEFASRAAGTFFSVEGDVVFTPAPAGRYRVYGKLDKAGSSVWLEDEKNGERVSDIVRGN